MKKRKFIIPPQIIERLEETRKALELSAASKPDVVAIEELYDLATAIAAARIYKADVNLRIESVREIISDLRLLVDNSRPPVNAEYVLHLVLGKEEREVIIGDLVEEYGRIMQRFGQGHADIWFYKQVILSVWPLLRRAVARVAAFVRLGRLLRRLIS
jgi:hypothetical protein